MNIINNFFLLLFFCQFLINCSSEKNVSNHHHHVEHYIGDYNIDSSLLFPAPVPDRIILNLTEDPLHSLAVNWRTDTSVEEGYVEITEATAGPDFTDDVRRISAKIESLSAKPEREIFEDEPEIHAYYHSAVIDDLTAGDQYVYRVGREGAWSEWFQITMPGGNSGSLSFIYFGDAQNNVKSMWSRVVRESFKSFPDVDFMLHAGDLINRHDRDLEWGEWFYSGDFIHAMIPSVMTPGNHEYGRDLEFSPQWRPQFNLPKNGPEGLEETTYFVNFPDLKVISLDAMQINNSEHYRNEQAQWLDSVLTHDSRKWTAITFHHPVFSTSPTRDNPELREHIKPILDKHQVDIVLQGHDHAYGRGMDKNLSTGASIKDGSSGPMYVVSVSGPKMYEVSDDEWMEVKAANTQLFQFISIDDNTLTYEAYTANGKLYDAFNLQKREDGGNELVNQTTKELLPDKE